MCVTNLIAFKDKTFSTEQNFGNKKQRVLTEQFILVTQAKFCLSSATFAAVAFCLF